jgi:quinol monooxygenase YgiN
MVRLSVSIQAPVERARTLAATLRVLMRQTRLQPGCTGCGVWTSNGEEVDQAEVHYEERWASEAAMQGRVRSEAFTKLLEVLEAAPGAPVVEFDFVSRQLGLEYVEAVRGANR